jgi:hypothetical protein
MPKSTSRKKVAARSVRSAHSKQQAEFVEETEVVLASVPRRKGSRVTRLRASKLIRVTRTP